MTSWLLEPIVKLFGMLAEIAVQERLGQNRLCCQERRKVGESRNLKTSMTIYMYQVKYGYYLAS